MVGSAHPTFLIFEIYKPKQRLQPGDKYQSKPQIAVVLVNELVRLGLKIKRVLADSLLSRVGTAHHLHFEQ
jgi:SRSO17 transposase